MLTAIIDVGTNAVRYLLAERKGNEWVDVEMGGAVTGLGRGLNERGELAPIAIEATVGAVSAFMRRLKSLGAQKFILLATQAVREASNSAMFVERLEKTVGVPPKILTTDEEATLAFIGATSGLKLRFQSDAIFAVADIGGGSTEVSIGKLGQPERWLSIPIGSRRLTEQFFWDDPPTSKQLDDCKKFALEQLQPAAFLLRQATVLVLTGGTAAQLGVFRLNLRQFDASRIHGLPIRQNLVSEWLEKLSTMPAKERRQVPGMEWGRETVILAGLLLLLTIIELSGKDTALLSARSVMHGALLTMA
ncbi:MAG: Ppx/GppA phosphatase family protein [Candidatus Fervidibacter sp.]|uniref:Ppx/GppA phosphatase family protein n=1 Tax=Candidatus Fervidibacter sp. TaxID=3100871 RepID=UPI00404A658B